MAKTLYLTDLDGTLLRHDGNISEFSPDIINRFIAGGGLFSYATGRSFISSSAAVKRLNINIPVICQTGAIIADLQTKKALLLRTIAHEDAVSIFKTLLKLEVAPLVYSYANGQEHIGHFGHESELCGQISGFKWVDSMENLAPIHKIFENDKRIHVMFQKCTYAEGWWCELLPPQATKAAAALEVKAMLGCDKIIAFGDGHNDISLFHAADESYAMANAVPELKAIATAVIESNENDGVAKWFAKKYF
ncbi:MAG: HAD family hydrolase [Clostridiales bacterium]|jgi:HAD superfamily hydrolase (TIGR01484 family)|nr:HAD family hydrolase [Clostridiales bacterium]